MMVIRDALLSQLQKDRLRQEIIVAELAKIERAMALRSAPVHGIASAGAERTAPASFAFCGEQFFMPHSRGAAGPERGIGVDEARDDLKMNGGVRGGAGLESEKPAIEDPGCECFKTSPGSGKAAGQENNAALDESNIQEPSETLLPKTTSPSVKWSCAICQVEATSEGNLLQHFAGQKHRATAIALKAKARAEKASKAMKYADKPRSTWVCGFCQANCTCKSDLEKHLKGKRHQEKIQSLLKESKEFCVIVSQDEDKSASTGNCTICQVKWTCQSVMESHLRGKKHQMNVQALQEEAKRLENILPQIAKKQQNPSEWSCNICQAKCNSESQFQDHCRRMGHQEKTEALHKEGLSVKSSSLNTAKKIPSDYSNSKGEISVEMEIQRALYFCKLCNLQCNSKNTLAEHRRGKKHLIRRRNGGR